ncbi:MAG: NAD(P)H-dependent glycerol-3-phosphate dehydrogenase [Planctomycetota bacterium]
MMAPDLASGATSRSPSLPSNAPMAFVLGAGSFAVALTQVLVRNGFRVRLWCRRPERAAALRSGCLPLQPDLASWHDRVAAIEPGDRADGPYAIAISVVPTQHLRRVLAERSSEIPADVPWVSASKGIEIGTQALPSQILRAAGLAHEVGVLSGPSHAEEVVRGVPTAVVLAHPDRTVGASLQLALSSDTFRVYLSDDHRGVELGGALKNVIAVAAGIALGHGFGDNSLAALVTRGSVEMARLGEALGGQARTFAGLSGVGDLIVTCFSQHSRNRAFGLRVGQGENPEELLANAVGVVEGAHTAKAVVALADEVGVEMPISEEVFRIVHERKPVAEGIRDLLRRSLKDE